MSEDQNFREFYGWVSSGDEGTSAVNAAAKRIKRSKKSVDISMQGTLRVIAGSIVILTGFRSEINGRYKVMMVNHSITSGGWITRITCEGG
jgi:UPF0716 family protein affecting phage T7 exclusion